MAQASPRGQFGRSHRLTRDGQVGAVALGADGTALTAWYAKGRVRATFHAPGEPFGPAETVPGTGPAEAIRGRFVLRVGDGPMSAAVR